MDDNYGQRVAGEVRAELARQRITGAALAAELDMSHMSVSRRLRGRQPFTVTELAAVARTLHVPIWQLLPPVHDVTRELGGAA